jgi:hypothetical protein
MTIVRRWSRLIDQMEGFSGMSSGGVVIVFYNLLVFFLHLHFSVQGIFFCQVP